MAVEREQAFGVFGRWVRAIKPVSGGGTSTVDEFARPAEIGRRHVERAERRQHDQSDAVGVERDVIDETLLDQQAKGLECDPDGA